jgi:hypothetical protein
VPAWNTLALAGTSSRPEITSPVIGASGYGLGRQHHAQRRARVPLRFDLVQAAIDGRFHQLDQVRLQAQHHRLFPGRRSAR